ncbi:MAG: hypothetical protein JKY54_19135 [Flavobacteriales bacterium]|nr:hypothetical protein [Flavobacteriales bacterium]
MRNSNTGKLLSYRNTPLTWLILIVAFLYFVPALVQVHITPTETQEVDQDE